AGVEEEPRQRLGGRQVREESRDLLSSGRIGMLLWTEPTHAQRRGPALSGEPDLRDPGIRPAGDDGVSCPNGARSGSAGRAQGWSGGSQRGQTLTSTASIGSPPTRGCLLSNDSSRRGQISPAANAS